MQRIPLVLVLVIALVVLGGAAAPVSNAAGSSSLVVSQVYGGGGNTGATYDSDYVEVFNRGSSSVDVSTWSVQYAPATGTNWQVTTLGGTIAPGHYFLVQLGTTGSVGGTLPLPDAVGSTNLAASGGKVAVVHSTDALTCGAAAGSCAAVTTVADLVGYGSASDFEGSAAGSLSASTAAIRAGAGCTDTDQNAADFTVDAPAPRSSASASHACSGTTQTAGPTQQAAVDLDIQPVLSIALDHPTLSFGAVTTGSTPAALPEHVTVFSNRATGYSLDVHRSVVAPADLPLAIAVGSGALTPLPIAPATDLLLGTSAAASAAAGDVWSTSVGFASALPAVAPGHYTATLTFTVVGR